MFAGITVGIFRRWQTKKKIAALLIKSEGKHTEAAILRDDSGSAYQITFHASGFYFRPSLIVAEFIPETMNVLHRKNLLTTVFGLRRDLDRALNQVFAWMEENKAKRLPQEEEMKLVRAMFEKGKASSQAPKPTAPCDSGSS
jgi:hypothetical protein